MIIQQLDWRDWRVWAGSPFRLEHRKGYNIDQLNEIPLLRQWDKFTWFLSFDPQLHSYIIFYSPCNCAFRRNQAASKSNQGPRNYGLQFMKSGPRLQAQDDVSHLRARYSGSSLRNIIAAFEVALVTPNAPSFSRARVTRSGSSRTKILAAVERTFPKPRAPLSSDCPALSMSPVTSLE